MKFPTASPYYCEQGRMCVHSTCSELFCFVLHFDDYHYCDFCMQGTNLKHVYSFSVNWVTLFLFCPVCFVIYILCVTPCSGEPLD